MKKACLFLFLAISMAGCNSNKNIPDISDIKVIIGIERFDESFFGTDTMQLDNGMNKLIRKFPDLLPIFLQTIVGVSDTTGIKTFIKSFNPQVYFNIRNIRKILFAFTSCKRNG